MGRPVRMVSQKEKPGMKRCYWLLGIWLAWAGIAGAQTFREYRSKTFDWGAKVGFNSAFPVIDRFTIDGVRLEDWDTEYKVGVLASLFCRMNIDRFFLQPSLEWTSSQSDLFFMLPHSDVLVSDGDDPVSPEHRRLKLQSVGVPVLIGYYVIKEGPYGLSLMTGPKIKYNYKNDFSAYFSDGVRTYDTDRNRWGVGIVAGVGVSIWRLFFDFTYEFGLSGVEADFREKRSSEPLGQQVRIDKRTNMMSFSLGFLF